MAPARDEKMTLSCFFFFFPQFVKAKLKGHRQDRLKRKLPVETQWLNAVEEDQRVKKKLVDFLETSEKQATENFAKITNTLNMLATSITEGFSLLRQAMQPPPPAQPAHYMPYSNTPSFPSLTPSFPSVHTNEAFHSQQIHTRVSQQNAYSTQNTSSSHTPTESTQLTGFSYTQALFSED